ncbi:SDR family NAD(P)-dependent oxidoreductase [bacterium]|nr:SDR family NAD(P)-dependent oxidoreductase [bacterium]
MGKWLRSVFDGRPWWMNLLMIFSAYMALVYVPWDLFVKPVAEDEEVWFGYLLHGWAAKATAPFHWVIYAAGAYGFRKMRSWMWPWASVYAAQVAVGMLVWNLVYGGGGVGSWLLGLGAFVPFAVLAAALWKARPLFGPGSLRERYGEWALITGASAGIGAAFARELARQGISCVLTARRGERLRALAAELEGRHGIATRAVPVDLADPDGADRLAEAVADLEIAVLVNNAGFGHAGRFEGNDPERLRAMIQVNCVAPVVLTSRLLPGMRERRRGAIVVLGSVAGRQPIPLHGVYSATKAFDLLFGESLYVELKGSGIDVVVLEPGSTDTEFQAVAGEIAHGGASPEQVARVGLEALGRQPSVIPGWIDWLRSNAAARLLPRPLVAHVAEGVFAARVPQEKR